MDPIEARRIRPGQDHTDVTIVQITDLLADLQATGRLAVGYPPPLVMLDAGNYATDISHALAGHPVQVLVRLRATRVFYADPEPRRPGEMGAGKRHGREFSCSDPAKRHAPDIALSADSPRYGRVRVRAWTGLHQKLNRTGRWTGHPADERLPIVRGTVIQIVVDRLPDGRKPTKDLWLWHTGPAPVDTALVDLLWKAYLRRKLARTAGDRARVLAMATLRAAGGHQAGFGELAINCAERIRALLAQPQRAPGDWSIALPAGCACELCEVLGTFLRHPERRALDWPLAKDKRRHVHARIDDAELPVLHETRRQSRPYTLVLTKTEALFERERLARERDQADLAWLTDEWKVST
ncbi:hypothetical protein [Nonomuraea sp. LPB2021202275-12-8]|uniref:hypothetical protein n=1 Tax=Nonomuraea sp. LPB2021202275-12-8 TaxID=3120159 RepID=UPI00300D4438